MDKFLGRALGAAALLAGAGIFYHYVIQLPAAERAKAASAAEAASALAQQQEIRSSQYHLCLSSAQQDYSQTWAEGCKNEAAENSRELKNCLSTPSIMQNQFMGRQWCEKQYGGIDPSANCSLPGNRADTINRYYNQAKAQCMADAKLGLQ